MQFQTNVKDKTISMDNFSDENGLHLVLGQVTEDSPAYECGVRSGDVIVTVNDWLITGMYRPQVSL